MPWCKQISQKMDSKWCPETKRRIRLKLTGGKVFVGICQTSKLQTKRNEIDFSPFDLEAVVSAESKQKWNLNQSDFERSTTFFPDFLFWFARVRKTNLEFSTTEFQRISSVHTPHPFLCNSFGFTLIERVWVMLTVAYRHIIIIIIIIE